MLAATLQRLEETQRQLAEALVANQRWQQSQTSSRNGMHWDDLDKFKLAKVFGGQRTEWDEWRNKVIGVIKTRSQPVCSLIKYMENKATEKEVEDDDFSETVPADQCALMEPDAVREAGSRLHHLLTELTTGGRERKMVF